jgi:hypothetical protein
MVGSIPPPATKHQVHTAMNSALLITFGCSWTYGIGLAWYPGMTVADYESSKWLPEVCDQFSFRGLLAKKYQLDTLNFSMGASSNQAQFRLAREYFGSELYQQHQAHYKNILVVWGITSTARNEFYFAKNHKRKNFIYTESTPIAKIMVTDHYDHAHEVEQLAAEIQFWNLFFEQNSINNIWFDTFNHHDYPANYKLQADYESVAGENWPTWQDYLYHSHAIDADILAEINDTARWNFVNYKPVDRKFLHGNTNPRDLLSQLAQAQGWIAGNDQYHYSDWSVDSERIELLKSQGLVNPISLHPTQSAHQHISQMFEPWFDKVLS